LEHFRKILKEQFGIDTARMSMDKDLFNQRANQVSNLGCLEFKYHDPQAEIDAKVKEITPFLNDLGIKFISVIKMTNTLVLTVTKQNAEQAKSICAKFGFTLLKETASWDATKPYNALANNQIPEMSNGTDFGRNSNDNRSSFTGGSMMTGYPVDRLAGE
jgi:hypothetical protein